MIPNSNTSQSKSKSKIREKWYFIRLLSIAVLNLCLMVKNALFPYHFNLHSCFPLFCVWNVMRIKKKKRSTKQQKRLAGQPCDRFVSLVCLFVCCRKWMKHSINLCDWLIKVIANFRFRQRFSLLCLINIQTPVLNIYCFSLSSSHKINHVECRN